MNTKPRRYKQMTISIFDEDLKRLQKIHEATNRNSSEIIRLCIKSVYNEMLRRNLINGTME